MPCYDVKVEETGMPPSAQPQPAAESGVRPSIVLAGSPNTGKTSLFNALTGLRTRTANFPGTTVEHKIGITKIGDQSVDLVDLPGMYSLHAATAEEKVAADAILGRIDEVRKPDAIVMIADASDIQRSLFLASQLAEANLPIVMALNMSDVAHSKGIHVDPEKLEAELGFPVVPTVACSGKGIEPLKEKLAELLAPDQGERIPFLPPAPACNACGTCPYQSRYSWTDQVVSRCVKEPRVAKGSRTEKIDEILTHPVVGLTAFMTVMLAVFYMIFSAASIPMDLIDGLFGSMGSWVGNHIPEGHFQSFIVDGIIGGVGGILVFLPQICILFLFLALLEDSGYLARAAFVMDRLMRRIGLPGTAFVPLLSAHACAIPAIMATRTIRDPRDRLVTILVAPLMTCSARIPVYAMVTALLFPNNPIKAALVFTGAYALGIFAALFMAFVFKKTILPGNTKPLVLELPRYRIPNIKSALAYTFDRAKVFVQQAGTIILVISVILWALATFPTVEPPQEVAAMQAQAETLAASGQVEQSELLAMDAQNLENRHALANSFAGRLGKFIEPVVKPLGFDWQIGIGVISSFAAREVIVSTLAIVYGIGEDAAEDTEGLIATLRQATHDNGAPVFTTAASISLLVFYVLAMQCLPTQAVTKRETNSWKWPIFQLVYMTALAYGAAFAAYRLVLVFTG